MATYLELKQRAEKMMAEAEQMRQKEISDVIAEIKEKMATHGITLSDLGGGGGRKRGGPAAPKKVKYRGPHGETWSGGRGRKPDWVMKALKDGKNIEEFAV